jgi:hypothetical protein
MEEIVLRVEERAVRGRDVELPGQRSGRAEGFLVEVVAPSADRLAEHETGRGDVEELSHGQPSQPGVAAAHEQAADDAAVNGKPALPDRQDLPGEL